MNTNGVTDPRGADGNRGWEGWLLGLIFKLVHSPVDNQHAANFLSKDIGLSHPGIEWCVVRPSMLNEGLPKSEYNMRTSANGTTFSLHTRIANVAEFIARLASESELWKEWKNKMPVILDADQSKK